MKIGIFRNTRGFLGVGGALAVLLTGMPAPSSTAAAPVVTEVSLAPTVLEAGLPYAATLVVSSTASLAVQEITVAVRDADGNQYDFPGAQPATIDGTYVFTSGSRSFDAGTYTVFGSYETSNTWHPLPSQTMTVAPASAAPAPVGIPGNWTLTLNDGPAQLAQWGGWFGTGVTGPVNSGEDACYDSANVSQSSDGSFLNMAFTNQQSTCQGETRPYTGALLSSDGIFQQTYGAFESEIYLPPAADGTIADWPAFWLDGTGDWPQTGEMDIMEGLSGQACYHFIDPSGNPGACDAATGPGWHTFGAEWQAGSVTYYYDGQAIGTISQGITGDPMYLILDLTDGPGIGGETVAPATMQVAYVRAWSSSS